LTSRLKYRLYKILSISKSCALAQIVLISEHYAGLEHPKTIHAFVLLPLLKMRSNMD
jgi:hypothetical protein